MKEIKRSKKITTFETFHEGETKTHTLHGHRQPSEIADKYGKFENLQWCRKIYTMDEDFFEEFAYEHIVCEKKYDLNKGFVDGNGVKL